MTTAPVGPQVRALRAEEAATAAALAAGAGVPFGDAASWLPGAGTHALASELNHALARGIDQALASKLDGVLAGVALGRVVADEGEVLVVAVTEAARRRGVGQALTAALLRSLEDAGASRVVLEVRAGNDAAVAMYRAAGLVEVGRRPRYYADDEDALLLATGLPPA